MSVVAETLGFWPRGKSDFVAIIGSAQSSSCWSYQLHDLPNRTGQAANLSQVAFRENHQPRWYNQEVAQCQESTKVALAVLNGWASWPWASSCSGVRRSQPSRGRSAK